MATKEATGSKAGGRTGAAQPGRFDAFKLASRGETLAGEVDLARSARVADRLAAAVGAASVSWRIEGGHDLLGRPMLTLSVQGHLPLVCQRCLQPFDMAIEQCSELLLARDEAESAQLDEGEREVVLASTLLDATTLVEDELLLSLPFAPMHRKAQCPAASVQASASRESGQHAASPFARLVALKKGRGGKNS